MADKKRLFVDLDGTLAVFKPTSRIEDLYEEKYFENLEPQMHVIEAVKDIIHNDPDVEVYILSSYLSDSNYALEEKNVWVDRYLPEIDASHRIFPPCGQEKREFVEEWFMERTGEYANLGEHDYLLDDYSVNLNSWEPPAKGIKLLNGINHTKGSWKNEMVDMDRGGESLARNIRRIMNQEPAFVFDYDPSRMIKSEENMRMLLMIAGEKQSKGQYMFYPKEDTAEHPEFYEMTLGGTLESRSFDSWVSAYEYVSKNLDRFDFDNKEIKELLELGKIDERDCWEAMKFELYQYLFQYPQLQEDVKEAKQTGGDDIIDKLAWYMVKNPNRNLSAREYSVELLDAYNCGDFEPYQKGDKHTNSHTRYAGKLENLKVPSFEWVNKYEEVFPGVYQRACIAYDKALWKKEVEAAVKGYHGALSEEEIDKIVNDIRGTKERGWAKSDSALVNNWVIPLFGYAEEDSYLYEAGCFHHHGQFADMVLKAAESAKEHGLKISTDYLRACMEDFKKTGPSQNPEDLEDAESMLIRSANNEFYILKSAVREKPYEYDEARRILDSWDHTQHEIFVEVQRAETFKEVRDTLNNLMKENPGFKGANVSVVPEKDIFAITDKLNSVHHGIGLGERVVQEACTLYLKENEVTLKRHQETGLTFPVAMYPDWMKQAMKYMNVNDIRNIYENEKAKLIKNEIREVADHALAEMGIDGSAIPPVVYRSMAQYVLDHEKEQKNVPFVGQITQVLRNYNENFRMVNDIAADNFLQNDLAVRDMLEHGDKEEFLYNYTLYNEHQYDVTRQEISLLLSGDGRDYMGRNLEENLDCDVKLLPESLKKLIAMNQEPKSLDSLISRGKSRQVEQVKDAENGKTKTKTGNDYR